MKNIGFIGLGNMGSRMALHLIKAGHNVEGFDTDEATVSELSKVGLVKRETLNELVSNKDFIITMLPNGDVVESVVNKILDNLTDGSIIIDCSTIDVNTVVKINSLLSDTGILGFGIFLIICLYYLLKSIKNNWSKKNLSASIINCLFITFLFPFKPHGSLFSTSTAFILWFIFSLLILDLISKKFDKPKILQA